MDAKLGYENNSKCSSLSSKKKTHLLSHSIRFFSNQTTENIKKKNFIKDVKMKSGKSNLIKHRPARKKEKINVSCIANPDIC